VMPIPKSITYILTVQMFSFALSSKIMHTIVIS
jgi:hypothetical protein